MPKATQTQKTMRKAKIVAAVIERALKASRDYPAPRARDIAFHMTDWMDDLARFHAFSKAPGLFTPHQVDDLLLAFLTHVPNHVAAAAKLMVDTSVADVFEVGAVECPDNVTLRPRGTRSNLRVQAPHSRVTTLAEKRKRRATRRAPDARRYADR